MNSTTDQLRRVFGATNATTPEGAARDSNRQFVRGRTQISPYDHSRRPKGRIISAYEAFTAYGLDVLDESVEYRSALLLARHNAVGDALRRQRETLGLDFRAVSRCTGVRVEDLKRIESGDAADVSMAAIERIAFTIGLDEAQLAFCPDLAGGAIAGRLKTLQTASPGSGLRQLTPKSVTTLTEAASVIRTQYLLQESLGFVGGARRFDPVDDYGNITTPAWKVGYLLAREARAELGLGRSPLKSMREFVQTVLGIPVVQAELPQRIAGATIAVTDGNLQSQRGILLNTTGPNLNPLVRRETLAHEVGHLLFDPDQKLESVRVDSYAGLAVNPEQAGSVDYVEQRANAFAISFLTPLDAIRDLLDPPVKEGDVAAIMSRFGISVTAARFHIENAYFKNYPVPSPGNLAFDTNEWRSAEDFGVDFFPVADTPILRRGRFSGLVVAAWRENLISPYTAANYLNCSIELFQGNAEHIHSMHSIT